MSNFVTMLTAIPPSTSFNGSNNAETALKLYSDYIYALNAIVAIFEKLNMNILGVTPVVFLGDNPFPTKTLTTTMRLSCINGTQMATLQKAFKRKQKPILGRFNIGADLIGNGTDWVDVGIVVQEIK